MVTQDRIKKLFSRKNARAEKQTTGTFTLTTLLWSKDMLLILLFYKEPHPSPLKSLGLNRCGTINFTMEPGW